MKDARGTNAQCCLEAKHRARCARFFAAVFFRGARLLFSEMINRVTELNLKRVFAIGPVLVLGFTSLLAVNGCSGTQPTEPSSGGTGASGGTSATGGTGAAGSPGSGGTSSSAGMPGSGGTSSSAGAGATGGSAGTGSMVPLPMPAECANVASTLTNGCGKIGCHRLPFPAGGLDLTPNSGLVGRVKDVVATHADIPCPDDSTKQCVPSTCPTGVKLVDSSNAMNSWINAKLEGKQNGCGDAMPTNGTTISAADKTCLEALVTAIAALPK